MRFLGWIWKSGVDLVEFALAYRPDVEQRILDALHDGALTSNQLAKASRLGALMYPTLMRMEDSGKVLSEWKPGPYPRQRLYRKPESTAPK
jgi:hypothetical protein